MALRRFSKAEFCEHMVPESSVFSPQSHYVVVIVVVVVVVVVVVASSAAAAVGEVGVVNNNG